jgi:hypothetical protein
MAISSCPSYRRVCRECGAVDMVWHKYDLKRLCRACADKALRTHGLTGQRIFRVYTGMLQRCGHYQCRPAHAKYYADKGVVVCEEWRADPLAFVAWARANGYADHLEIDRIDSGGPYSPDNCRFITTAENRRRSNHSNRPQRKLSKEDVERAAEMRKGGLTWDAIAKSFGVSSSTLRKRLGLMGKGRSPCRE